MRHIIAIAIAVAMLTAGFSLAQTSRADESKWKDADHLEKVVGDLEGAMALYKDISRGKDRALAAKSLLRMAAIYTVQGNAEAMKVCERIVREFPEQKESVTEAQKCLSSLSAQTQPTNPQGAGVPRFGMSVDAGWGSRLVGFKYELVWFDRTGKQVGNKIQTDGNSFNLELSPDSKRIAFLYKATLPGEDGLGTVSVEDLASIIVGRLSDPAMMASGNANIWIYELETGRVSPFTHGNYDDRSPKWSPDGAHIAFVRRGKDVKRGVYRKQVNGTAAEELLAESTSAESRSCVGRSAASCPADQDVSWTADGQSVVYTDGGGVWSLPLKGNRKPLPVLTESPTAAAVASGSGTDRRIMELRISPNGKWIAYRIGNAIYVSSYPNGAGEWKVADRGWAPRWRGDSKELYFTTVTNSEISSQDALSRLRTPPITAIMTSEILVVGSSIQSDVPHELFLKSLLSDKEYAPSSDGKRFLAFTLNGGAPTSSSPEAPPNRP